MVLSVLPISAFSVAKWASLRDLLAAFRFEFTYCPVFILLVGALLKTNHEWVILRRYKQREQIVLYKIWLVIITAFLFVLSISIIGYLIYLTMTRLTKINIEYTSFLYYLPGQADALQSFLHLLILFLILCILGIGLVIFYELTGNYVLSAFAIISITVIDKNTIAAIPLVLNKLVIYIPIHIIAALFIVFFILANLAGTLSKNKNFYRDTEV